MKNSFKILHSQLERSHIDAQLSGSTCCLLLITASTIYCSNIGDSRALLINQERKWAYKALSKDHKPEVFLERKRIIQCKGRICPYYGN